MCEKKLELVIQPRVIDHLGIKMYQKPVDVVSELVANAWDADAEKVDISIDKENNKILVKDNGHGMTFDECQKYYLSVGRDRRQDLGKETSEGKERPVLGRKGIGKFAGFGIADKITIETISKANGEKTKFLMDLNEILKCDSENHSRKPIKVNEATGPDEDAKNGHGTIIELIIAKDKSIDIDITDFVNELSSRFLLAQLSGDFSVSVNGNELKQSFADEMEFVFPRDFTVEERKKIPLEDSEDETWAKEKLDGYEIYWRVGFYEETIKCEYLRGVSVFSRGKIAQKPFFFDLSGGISGQNALEYMTGQVKMDFIDEGRFDLISTERQRINLQTEIGKKIQKWGISRIKFLAQIWKNRRSKKRLQEIEDKVSGFKDRLDVLPSHERKTVKSVLTKIATFERLGKNRFQDWCNAVLTSWETGRLRELLNDISEAENLDEAKLLEVLSEADVLTALNIAEAIKTKIVTIGELKLLVNKGELENTVRNFIYARPWIINPKWEQFKKERSVEKLIKDIGSRKLNEEIFKGRVDLALSSGSTLLLIEFMRPGLRLNTEHLDRLNYYVMEIRNAIDSETGSTIKVLETAYIVADNFNDSKLIRDRIEQLKRDNILFVTWDTLIGQSIKQWEEFLDLLKSRNPGDKRIQAL